ncbi:MAG TPA: DUF5691 domain-containing protein, partial [Saprospiraceae bacterium]|nr:DUF5691 domain-containing protein [Saprospiraceae bacterium]
MRELWEHLQHVLLLGTGRTSLSEKARQQLKQLGLKNNQRSEALQVLSALSLLHFLKRGARQLPKLEQPLAKAPGELAVYPSPQLGRLVERMLSNEELRPILLEYIEYSASLDLLLPPEALPFLFTSNQNNPEQIQLIREVMGQRGEWLARQNPAWAIFSQQFDKEIWAYGTVEERVGYFAGLRQQSPETARALLEKDWAKEPRNLQLRLLSKLRYRLALEDVPFLTNCLAHSDSSIRTLAAKLLMCLPESAFYEKMQSVFEALFIFEAETFQVNKEPLPADLADDLLFLTGGKASTSLQKKVGVQARFLIRIVPPSFWEKLSDRPTDKAFQALQSAPFYTKYRLEVAESIDLHQDIWWMRLFIPAQYELDKGYWEDTAIERLASKLPYEVFTYLTTRYVQFHNDLIPGHSLVYTILRSNTHFWSAALS